MSMRGGGTRLDSEQAAKAVIFERRLLIGCTLSVLVGLVLWVVSISTEYWFTVHCANASYVENAALAELGPGHLISSHSGLWRTCKTLLINETETSSDSKTTTVCRYMRVKFLPNRSDDDPLNVIIAYRRTCLGFSVISLLLLGLSIFFSIYTFRVRRYTFKRVAACLHFIVAGVQLVVIEVQVTSLHFQDLRAISVLPGGCEWDYSASFVLGWICFMINLVCGVGFLYTSSKKKKRPEGNAAQGQEAEDDFDDEPQIMGR